MNFEVSSSFLRDTVSGKKAEGGQPARLGLLEFVKKYGPAGSVEREDAITDCGRILGTASMLAGLKEKG